MVPANESRATGGRQLRLDDFGVDDSALQMFSAGRGSLLRGLPSIARPVVDLQDERTLARMLRDVAVDAGMTASLKADFAEVEPSWGNDVAAAFDDVMASLASSAAEGAPHYGAGRRRLGTVRESASWRRLAPLLRNAVSPVRVLALGDNSTVAGGDGNSTAAGAGRRRLAGFSDRNAAARYFKTNFESGLPVRLPYSDCNEQDEYETEYKKVMGWHYSGGLYCICALSECDYYDAEQVFCKNACAITQCPMNWYLNLEGFKRSWRNRLAGANIPCSQCPEPYYPESLQLDTKSTWQAGNGFMSLGQVWATATVPARGWVIQDDLWYYRAPPVWLCSELFGRSRWGVQKWESMRANPAGRTGEFSYSASFWQAIIARAVGRTVTGVNDDQSKSISDYSGDYPINGATGDWRWHISSKWFDSKQEEFFMRCRVPRHTGMMHPSWEKGKVTYAYKPAPGFRFTGGSLVRKCMGMAPWFFSGEAPRVTCAGIPLIGPGVDRRTKLESHTCNLQAYTTIADPEYAVNGVKPGFFGSGLEQQPIAATGPSAWERNGGWMGYEFKNQALEGYPEWPLMANKNGYRVAILGGARVTLQINRQPITMRVNETQTKYESGVIVLEGTHTMPDGASFPVYLYVRHRYHRLDPDQPFKPMPFLEPTNFSAAWFGADASFNTQMGRAFVPTFKFGNMNAPPLFDLHFGWRAGPAPTGNDAADGAGMQGLYDYVRGRYDTYFADRRASLRINKWSTFEPMYGEEVANAMNLGIEFKWVYPFCKDGQYQIGNACKDCPDNRYVDFPAAVYSSNPRAPHPCKNCSNCDRNCEDCNKKTGACSVWLDKCKIDNVCRDANQWKWDGVTLGEANSQCQKCVPAVSDDKSRYRWTTVSGSTCNDFNKCTFKDRCSLTGQCVGTADDCLREAKTGKAYEDCEVCGQDRCEMARVADGRDRGCLKYDFLYETVTRTVTSIFCLNTATNAYGKWDDKCLLVQNRPWIYGNYTYTVTEKKLKKSVTGAGQFIKRCGCKIDGVCYAHGTPNPVNPCDVCDVVNDPFGWSLQPIDCDDGQMCTSQDMCRRVTVTGADGAPKVQNQCVGSPYTCPRGNENGQIAPQSFDCSTKVQCDGTGGCFFEPKVKGTVCYNITDTDVCMPTQTCDGLSPVCKAVTRLTPNVFPGAIVPFALNETAYNVTAGEAPVYGPLSGIFRFADAGSPYLDFFPVAMVNWTTVCGWVEFAAGYYTVDSPADTGCLPNKANIRSLPVASKSNRTELQVIPFDDPRYPVKDGSWVKIVIRTRNTDGNVNNFCLGNAARNKYPPVVVDSTRPEGGKLVSRDPNRPKLGGEALFHSAPYLALEVSGFVETFNSTWSGSFLFEYSVAAYPLNTSLPSWWVYRATNAGRLNSFAVFNTGWSLTDNVKGPYDLPDATRYVAFVRAYNRAGLASAWVRSNDIVVDRTPPVANETRLTDGLDVSAQTFPLSLDWTGVFTDPESDIDYYQVGWGTRRGSDNIVNWVTVSDPTVTRYEESFSDWRDGVRYFGSVKAFNRAGGYTLVTAAGQRIDYTAPFSVSVTGPVTTTSPLRWVTRYDVMKLRYAYREDETAFLRANVTISAVRFNASDLLFASLYGGAYASGADLALPSERLTHNQTVFVCVSIQNSAKLWAAPVCRAFTVDAWVPRIDDVFQTRPGQTYRNYTVRGVPATSECLKLVWAPCANDVSGIDRYELRVTANVDASGQRFMPLTPGPDPAPGPGGYEILPWTSQGMALTGTFCHTSEAVGLFGLRYTITDMRPGWSYYATVRCTTGSGLDNATTSLSTVFDVTPPTIANAGFGSLSRLVRWTNSLTQLRVFWRMNDPESAVARVDWAIGTACGRATGSVEDVKAFSTAELDDPTAAQYLATGLSLATGDVRYCLTLRSTNIAGLTSTLTAPAPVKVDLSPPYVKWGEVVRDGFDRSRFSDADYAGNCEEVAASWAGTFNDDESPMTDYIWCAGTAPGLCDVLPWTMVWGNLTSRALISAATMNLHGRVVYTTVNAWNEAGSNVTASSDGALYDCTRPNSGSLDVIGDRFASVRAASLTEPFVRPAGYVPPIVWVPSLSGLRFAARGFNTTIAPLAEFGYALNTTTVASVSSVFAPVVTGVVSFTRSSLNTGFLQELAFASGVPDGTAMTLSVTAIHAGGAGTTAVLPYAIGVDRSPPVLGSVSMRAIPSAESLLPLCFTNAGDAHSGIHTAYVQVFALNTTVATLATSFFPAPALVAALARPGIRNQTCVEVVVPDMPGGVPLRATVTLVNGAGLASNATSPVFFIRASVPELRSLTIPPQKVNPDVNGAIELRLFWPLATDVHLPCCNYTLLASPVNDAASAAVFPVVPSLLTPAVGAFAGSMRYTLRIPNAPAGRLYFWLRASNSLNGSTTLAANRAVAVVPRDASLRNASVILRAGQVGVGELLRGHQARLTDPDVVTVLFDPGAIPNVVVGPVLYEASLQYYYWDEVFERVRGPLPFRGTMWTEIGLNRTWTFRGLALRGANAGYRMLQAYFRVTYANGETATWVSNTSSTALSPTTIGEAALVGGAAPTEEDPVVLQSAPLLDGMPGSVAVTWTTASPEFGVISIALGTKPMQADVMAFRDVTGNITVSTPEGAADGADVPSPAATLYRASLTGVDFPYGLYQPVYVTVRAQDPIGNVMFATSSNATLLVTLPPEPFPVWNTQVAGVNALTVDAVNAAKDAYDIWASWVPPGGPATAAQLRAWNNSGVASGLLRYELAVSTSPDETDSESFLTEWKAVDDVTATSGSVLLANFPPVGLTVYMLVAAVSNAGLRRVVASKPQVLDNTVPTGTAIVHPSHLGRADVITARWSFSSLRAGRDLTYEVSMGTVAGSGDVFPATNVGNLMSYTWSALPLVDDAVLYIAVKGCNGLGVCDTIISASGLRLLLGVPVGGAVALSATPLTVLEALTEDGVLSSAAEVRETTPLVTGLHIGDTVYVAFDAFTVDYPSIITRYAVALGDGPGLGTLGSCTPNVTNVGAPVLSCAIVLQEEPSHQARLWATATAFSTSGVASSVVSNYSISVDRTEPSPFDVIVLDPFVEAPFTNVTGVYWQASEDPESGPVVYEFSIVDAFDALNVIVPWIPVALDDVVLAQDGERYVHAVLEFSATAILPAGTYLVGIRANNSVGLSNYGWAASPVVVDTSAPMNQSAVVTDGHRPTEDARYITPRSASGGFASVAQSAQYGYKDVQSDVAIDIWISWSGFSESESWIDHYLVGLGTSRDGPNVAPMRRTTGFSSHVFPVVPSPPGMRFYGFVQAVNVLGLVSNASISNGAEVDLYAPFVAQWAVNARNAALHLADANELRNVSRYGDFLATNGYRDSFHEVLDATRPLMTAGLDFSAPAAIVNGTACQLTNWPFEAMNATVLNFTLFNEYNDTAGDGNATAAPPRTAFVVDAGVTVSTVCEAGAYRLPFGPCVPCPAGQYKPAVGDADACFMCPDGTLDEVIVESTVVLNPTRKRMGANATGATSCRCLDDTQVYSHAARGCMCRPGFLPNEFQSDILSQWRGRGEVLEPMCIEITGHFYKPDVGDSALSIRACPNGTAPNDDHSTCLCSREDQAFDPVARRCGCSPGRYLGAVNGTAQCTECPDGSFKTVPGDGIGLCKACPFGSSHNRTRNGCKADPTIVAGADMMPDGTGIACPPGTQYTAQVTWAVSLGDFVVENPACAACPAGLFQPLHIPLTDVVDPATVPVRCGVCPGLVQGSYFASAVPDLYIDWSGVFDDVDGSGIEYFEVAVGSVVGGSQIVPFTWYPPRVTNITLTQVKANPGSPLFLTLVAVDRAGNGAVFEDVRPVFLDGTAPQPGFVVDGGLDGFAGKGAKLSSSAQLEGNLETAANLTVALNSTSESAKDDGRIASLYDVLGVPPPLDPELGRRLHMDDHDDEDHAEHPYLDRWLQASTSDSRSGTPSISVSATGTYTSVPTRTSTPSPTRSRNTLSNSPTATVTPMAWVQLGSAKLAAWNAPFPATLTRAEANQVGAIWSRYRLWSESFEVSFRMRLSDSNPSPSASPIPFADPLPYYRDDCLAALPNRGIAYGTTGMVSADGFGLWESDNKQGKAIEGWDWTHVRVIDLGDNWEAVREQALAIDTCDPPSFGAAESELWVGNGCPSSTAEFRQTAFARATCACSTGLLGLQTCYGANTTTVITQRYVYVVVGSKSLYGGGYNLKWRVAENLRPRSATPSPSSMPSAYAHHGEGMVFAVVRGGAFSNLLGAGDKGLGFSGLPARGLGIRMQTRVGTIQNSTFGYVYNGTISGRGEVWMPTFMQWTRTGGYDVRVAYDGVTRRLSFTATSIENPAHVFTNTTTVDLPALLGCPSGVPGCDAFIGFTASTGGAVRTSHVVHSFAYTNARPSITVSPSFVPTSSPNGTASSSQTASASPSAAPVDKMWTLGGTAVSEAPGGGGYPVRLTKMDDFVYSAPAYSESSERGSMFSAQPLWADSFSAGFAFDIQAGLMATTPTPTLRPMSLPASSMADLQLQCLYQPGDPDTGVESDVWDPPGVIVSSSKPGDRVSMLPTQPDILDSYGEVDVPADITDWPRGGYLDWMRDAAYTGCNRTTEYCGHTVGKLVLLDLGPAVKPGDLVYVDFGRADGETRLTGRAYLGSGCPSSLASLNRVPGFLYTQFGASSGRISFYATSRVMYAVIIKTNNDGLTEAFFKISSRVRGDISNVDYYWQRNTRRVADGITFVLSSAPGPVTGQEAGSNSYDPPYNASWGLGYAGIPGPSLALRFDTFSRGVSRSTFGLLANGTFGDLADLNSITWDEGEEDYDAQLQWWRPGGWNVSVSYAARKLMVTWVARVGSAGTAPFSKEFSLDLNTALGCPARGCGAYMGFTASIGGDQREVGLPGIRASSTQRILDFWYTNAVPTPSMTASPTVVASPSPSPSVPAGGGMWATVGNASLFSTARSPFPATVVSDNAPPNSPGAVWSRAPLWMDAFSVDFVWDVDRPFKISRSATPSPDVGGLRAWTPAQCASRLRVRYAATHSSMVQPATSSVTTTRGTGRVSMTPASADVGLPFSYDSEYENKDGTIPPNRLVVLDLARPDGSVPFGLKVRLDFPANQEMSSWPRVGLNCPYQNPDVGATNGLAVFGGWDPSVSTNRNGDYFTSTYFNTPPNGIARNGGGYIEWVGSVQWPITQRFYYVAVLGKDENANSVLGDVAYNWTVSPVVAEDRWAPTPSRSPPITPSSSPSAYTNYGEGLTMVIQNDPRGPTAIGTGSDGLGYAGVNNSLALRFDLADGQFSRATFDWAQNGLVRERAGMHEVPTSHAWWRAGGFRVRFSYQQALRRAQAVIAPADDPSNTITYTADVDLRALLKCDVVDTLADQGCLGYLGFTASTSAGRRGTFRILDAAYSNARPTKSQSPSHTPSNTPSPSAAADLWSLTTNAGDDQTTRPAGRFPITLISAANQRASAFTRIRIPAEAFDVSFRFAVPERPTAAAGHGFAFVMHRDRRGMSALGQGDQGLGFEGIKYSVGLRFDMRGQDGLQKTTLGLETGGAFWWKPAGDLALPDRYRWPDIAGRGWNVTMSYNRSTSLLDVLIASNVPDMFDPAQFSLEVDIPTQLGCAPGPGCEAYFGFTAANGPVEGEASSFIVQDFQFLNAQASPSATPSNTRTPSNTATPSITPSMTPSASVGPAGAAQQLASYGESTLALTCSGDASTPCASALNLCRTQVQNTRQQLSVFALGRNHACAIDFRGDLRCFGDNITGAVVFTTPGRFRHVTVTDACTCALRSTGAIRCWGANSTGCPSGRELTASVRGGWFTHFGVSEGRFLVATTVNRTVECVGDRSLPGCGAAWPMDTAFVAVSVSGAATCALADNDGFAGDMSAGGQVVCAGTTVSERAGPYGTIAGVGSAGTFCGLFSFNSDPARAGKLDCWGPAAAAVMASARGLGPFRQLAGSYHDPIGYALDRSTGMPVSFDGHYDTSRGCAGAPCACSPGSAACDARSSARMERSMAQAPANSGLTNGVAKMSCGVTCGFSVACFMADSDDPSRNYLPGWLKNPCALSVPMDVGAPRAALPPVCSIDPEVRDLLGALSARSPDICNARGVWNDGTLVIGQAATQLRLFPQAERYGNIVYRSRLDYNEPAQLGGASIYANSLIVGEPVAGRPNKGTGRFSPDCSMVSMSDGTMWNVTRRCSVRYLRISRGSASNGFNRTLPFWLQPGINYPGVPRALDASGALQTDGGQPALVIGDIQVFDHLNRPLHRTARLTASSISPLCTAGADACLAAAVDESGSNGVGNDFTFFATDWSWPASHPQRDPYGWLQLDFGREVYISRIQVKAVNPRGAFTPDFKTVVGTTSTRAAALAEAALLGITIEGFDDNSFMPDPPPLDASSITPQWTYTVVNGSDYTRTLTSGTDARSTPGYYTFTSVERMCGYDGRGSATPSISASPSQSGSRTPSRTSSTTRSPTQSSTASVSGSQTATAAETRSATASVSNTGSATASPSSSASESATPSMTPTPVFKEFRRPENLLNESTAEAIATTNVSGALGPYDWRTDSDFTSLGEAPDIDFQVSTDTMALAWEPFEDVGSGVAKVAFCLGHAQFMCDYLPWVTAESVKTHVDYAVVTGLNLTAGTVVFATVAAVNHVGLVSMTSSDGVYVDDRAPFIPTVYDTGKYYLYPNAAPGAGTALYRPPVDINCDIASMGVGAAWQEAIVFSGVREYAWAVGTAPNATDILDWTPLGEAVAAYNSTLVVPIGVTYFTSVRATGRNGYASYASSNGVLVIDDADASASMHCLSLEAAVNSTLAAAGGVSARASGDDMANPLEPVQVQYVSW